MKIARKVSEVTQKIFSVLGIFLLFGFFSVVCSALTNVSCYFILHPIGSEILRALYIGIPVILVSVYLGSVIGIYESRGKEFINKHKPWGYVWIIPVLALYFPVRILFYNIIWKIIIGKILIDFIWRIIILGIYNGIKSGITEYCGIFSDYLNASYSDYCPSIDWKENKKEEEE